MSTEIVTVTTAQLRNVRIGGLVLPTLEGVLADPAYNFTCTLDLLGTELECICRDGNLEVHGADYDDDLDGRVVSRYDDGTDGEIVVVPEDDWSVLLDSVYARVGRIMDRAAEAARDAYAEAVAAHAPIGTAIGEG
jgi:hypothetical protein